MTTKRKKVKRKPRKKASSANRFAFARNEVAEIFEVTVRTVNKWTKAGQLPRAVGGKRDLREIIAFLNRRIVEAEKSAGVTATERWQMARARREELKLGTELGELVAREAVIRWSKPALIALKSAVLGLPERILHYVPDERRSEVRTELREICESHLKEFQEALRGSAG